MSDLQILDKLVTILRYSNLLLVLDFVNELNVFPTVYHYISDMSFNVKDYKSKQKALLVSNNIDKLQGNARNNHIQVLQFYNKQNSITTRYTYYCN